MYHNYKYLINSIQYFATKKHYQYYPQTVKKYFKNDLNLALEQINKIRNDFNIPYSTCKVYFKKYPQLFITNSILYQIFKQKINWFENNLNNPYMKFIHKILHQNRFILFQMDYKDIQNVIQTLKQYNINQDQAESIFCISKNVINSKFKNILISRQQLFHDYLQLNRKQCVFLWLCSPILLSCSCQKLQMTLKYLLSKKIYGITKDMMINLLKRIPEVVLLSKYQIDIEIKQYKKWNVEQTILWKLIFNHPMLLMNYFQVMPYKLRIFRYFKFTHQMGYLMLSQYPSILCSSIRSLQSKLIFFQQRLKLEINSSILPLLCFSFNSIIRARGEIIIRTKSFYTIELLLTQYFVMDEDSFIQKFDITMSRLEQEKQKYKQTDEIDYRRTKIGKYGNSYKKLVQELWRMRNNELQKIRNKYKRLQISINIV